MHRALPLLLLLTTVLPTQLSLPQERFDSGPQKGFLKSSTEHIIVELSEPFEVTVVRGVVRGVTGSPLSQVDFEIRDSRGSVLGTKTDRFGRFNIANAPRGQYEFKATRDGFQSIIGKIIVSKKPSSKASILLSMSVGV